MKVVILSFGLLLGYSCTLQDDKKAIDTTFSNDTIEQESALHQSKPPDLLITWDSLLNILNTGKLKLDSIGKFETERNEEVPLSDCIGSLFQGKSDTFQITYVKGKMRLYVNNIRYSFISDNEDPIENYNFVPNAIYQCNTGKGMFSFFSAGLCNCNGTMCTVLHYFIINHANRTCYVFSERSMFPDIRMIIADIDNDNIPEYLQCVRMSSFYNAYIWSDTTELLKIIPYRFTEEKTYKPILKHNGDTLYYNTFGHYEYDIDQGRIWSKPCEGNGIVFKEKKRY